MIKTTIIQHPEYGRVEEVERSMDGWTKKVDGVICWYTIGNGWSEVPLKRDVTGDITNICDIKYHLSSDSVNFYEFSFTINKSDKRVAPKLEGRKVQAVEALGKP